MFFYSANGGSAAYYEMIGLYKQLTATTGTLFNIDRAAVTLFQGTTVSAGNESLTQAFITQQALKLAGKGNFEPEIVCLVDPASWADLNTENMTLRMFDSSYSDSEATNGSEKISYQVLNGKVRIVCHPIQKQGFAFMFSAEHLYWVGSSDVTFNVPGMESEKLFLNLTDAAGYEMRAYVNKQLYLSRPSQALAINNIVPQSGV